MTDSFDPSDIPLYIPRSTRSTEANFTGSWRFMRPEYDEKTAPCSQACPVGQDIARIEMLASEGLFLAAWETIMRENPFPAVCGRVCFHPCERACNRGFFDQPVAVHHIERAVGDMALDSGFSTPHPFYGDEGEVLSRKASGRRIAIAGAGPSGLAAAYFLTRLGHRCEVFEASPEPGGVLRWGIPAYRLPDEVLKKEVARIMAQGVTIRCNAPVSPDFVKDAASDFDGFFLATGYGRPLRLSVPGDDLARDGLDILQRVRRGLPVPPVKKAAVIGGGNTAVDVARTLARLGAETVIIYRRRRRDMPAFDHETARALEEGVGLMEMASPVAIEKTGSRLRLTIQPMRLSDMETQTGRARTLPSDDPPQTILVDAVVAAIGADAAIPADSDAPGVLTFSHTLFVPGDRPVVYGGDLATPVKSVTDAIASGKQAAMSLDTYFREGISAVEARLSSCRVGDGPALSMEIYLSGVRKQRNPKVIRFDDLNLNYFTQKNRVEASVLAPARRVCSFEEAMEGIGRENTLEEASRCFNCGVCNDCDNCRLFCPELAVFFNGARCINLAYCKGCGICVTECPRNAMSLTEETHERSA